jgi:hypothetical protein
MWISTTIGYGKNMRGGNLLRMEAYFRNDCRWPNKGTATAKSRSICQINAPRRYLDKVTPRRTVGSPQRKIKAARAGLVEETVFVCYKGERPSRAGVGEIELD